LRARRGAAGALVVAAGLCVLTARDARACASCGCGDPTLTALGTEQPFAGRLRSSLELSYRTDSIGRAGIDRLELRELRADASAAWAPLASLFVVANVPLVHRQATDPSLAQTDAWGLGDVELRAKWFVLRDRAFAPRWLLAAVGGLKFPTAPWQSDGDGVRVPLEAQPGTGSLDLLLGPSVSMFQGDVSAYASLQGSLPLTTRAPLEPGSSLRASLALQHQTLRWLALRAAADGRWDRPSREAGQRDPDSGGGVLFLGGDALFSPMLDLALSLGIRLPALDALHGAHDEGPRLSLALMRDW
jgi:hypothetical protein